MQPASQKFAAALQAGFGVLLFWGAASHAPMAMAQSPGTFTATGDMNTPRGGHTATLLADGTVLIVGGYPELAFGVAVLSSAEIYDPRTGTFKATGDMTTPRNSHTATLLPDGKVLIAGGVSGVAGIYSGSLASAELYDPATKTFTPTGDMTVGRRGHAATLLPSGKVLITGVYAGEYISGRAADLTPITAELYDPSNRTFTAAGNMAGPGGGATLLASGKVLITPHFFDARPIQSEIYDPSTGMFASTVNQSGCCESTATLLMNGNVLVAYGTAYGVRGGIAELYDPVAGIFTATENMATDYRIGHTATLLSDGNVLLVGGCTCFDSGDDVFFASAEVYDAAKRTFRSTGSMQANRFGHTATLLNDGRVLIAGGLSFVGQRFPDGSREGRTELLSSAEVYTPPIVAPEQ